MSQTLQPGVINGTLCMRGVDVRRRPSLVLSNNLVEKQLGDQAMTELIQMWKKVKDRRSLDFCWTDKVEYQIIKLDNEQVQAVLCLEQDKLLRRIQMANARIWAWQPGFAKFTIEASNTRAYSPQLEDLLSIERNFMRRRKYLRSLLNSDQIPFTLSILPDFDAASRNTPKSHLPPVELPKAVLRTRQRSLGAHVRSLSIGAIPRGNQSEPASPTSPTSKYPRLVRPRLRSIASDSMMVHEKVPIEPPIFEPNARGLQITFGCHDLREARYLHDQMCVLSPIMLAFTASTPVHQGRVSDFDVRIRPSSRSATECRTGERCSLARPWRLLYPTYLGLDAPRSRITRSNTNRDIFQLLRMEGFDDAMAMFCAQGYTCAVPQNSKEENTKQVTGNSGSDLFKQFTTGLNPYVQLELPSPNDLRVGFRVTFGAMENQLTDFSNAACIFFVALLRFAILGFDLDFRLPPHMVAENVAKAHKEDSIRAEKFWWRSVRWNSFGFQNNGQPLTTDTEPTQVSIDHIINGDPSRPETVGLSGVLDSYLADVEDGSDAGSFAENGGGGGGIPMQNEVDAATISRYLAFIRRRAKGSIWTDARLIRNFIVGHPEFEDNSLLSSDIWFDLVRKIDELNEGMMRPYGM